MEPNGTDKRLVVAAALIAMVLAAGMAHVFKYRLFLGAAMMLNYARSSLAPPGTLTLEMAPVAQHGALDTPVPTAAVPGSIATSLDWPGYNRTLTSARYSPLDQINRENV